MRGNQRWPLNSPHKGQYCGALMYPLICAWTNDGVNNWAIEDLRRHRAHYDVIVMVFHSLIIITFYSLRSGILRALRVRACKRFWNSLELFYRSKIWLVTLEKLLLSLYTLRNIHKSSSTFPIRPPSCVFPCDTSKQYCSGGIAYFISVPLQYLATLVVSEYRLIYHS